MGSRTTCCKDCESRRWRLYQQEADRHQGLGVSRLYNSIDVVENWPCVASLSKSQLSSSRTYGSKNSSRRAFLSTIAICIGHLVQSESLVIAQIKLQPSNHQLLWTSLLIHSSSIKDSGCAGFSLTSGAAYLI